MVSVVSVVVSEVVAVVVVDGAVRLNLLSSFARYDQRYRKNQPSKLVIV